MISILKTKINIVNGQTLWNSYESLEKDITRQVLPTKLLSSKELQTPKFLHSLLVNLIIHLFGFTFILFTLSYRLGGNISSIWPHNLRSC